ncbi:MAG TPA: regulatory protein RecX [Halanaerobiales bacterium]|nr:regulatory protein RecX [Halanaerobiales bacterium]
MKKRLQLVKSNNKNVKKADNNQQARDDAFNLLSYRERSEAELESRLLKKGYTQEIVRDVVQHLKELDYINDKRFAIKWINYRIKNNPRGRFLLQRELKEKGITYDIIKTTIQKLISDELEIKMGVKLACKWLDINKNKSDYKVKLMNYLQRKGFSVDKIYAILDKINLN